VHYAREYGGEVTYRMGTPNSDGSITWLAAEQVVHAGYNRWVSIAVDSNGYPWVGYTHSDDGGTTWYPYVNKSSKKDGTWVDDTGFPKKLSDVSQGYSYWMTIVLPLTAGKMYVLYQTYDDKPKGILYDGGWGSEETCTTTAADQNSYCAVAESDDIHMVFRGDIYNYDLRYVKRTYGVGWGGEVILKSTLGGVRQQAHISIDQDNGNLYLFFGNTVDSTIELKVYRAGAWEEWFTYLTEPNTLQMMPISFYQKYGRAIGILWVRGAASPYDIRYNILTLLPTNLKNTPNSGL
jgi:hypothetical protein